MEDSKYNYKDNMPNNYVSSNNNIQVAIAAVSKLPPQPEKTPVPKPSKNNDSNERYQLSADSVQQIIKRSCKS